MAAVTWGQLAKSLISPQLIEERIAEMIAEHNKDETAHLGAGQSLQSHKASEIIDHVAYSIISDKYANESIDLEKFLNSKWDVHNLMLESIDGWTFSNPPEFFVGYVSVQTGNTYPSSRYGRSGFGVYPTWDKKLQLQFVGEVIWPLRDQITVFGTGDYDENPGEDQFVGFWFEDGVLYACHSYADGSDTIFVKTEITGVDMALKHKFRIDFDPATGIKFYIDNILKVTHTENLPTDEYSNGSMFYVSTANKNAQTVGFDFYPIYWAQQI